MKMLKLVKNVKLYKPQFDLFNLYRTGGHEIDRISLELDSLLFKIKYMDRKGYKDYDKYKSEFTNKAMYLRKLFGMFMYDFLSQIITIPKDCHLEDIYDVLAKDVKINTNYVSFTMILFSNNRSYLEFVDSSIKDRMVFDMFPNEYFRFQTDSYNDAISKAFPELFENKHQDIIGTGADKDIFVHNLTFQTTERCSLNCFAAGTKVLMHDGSYKNIEDIKVGDKVIGFDEIFNPSFTAADKIAEVTHVFHNTTNKICKLKTVLSDIPTYVTPNHEFATSANGNPNRGKWMRIDDMKPDRNPIYKARSIKSTGTPSYCWESKIINKQMDVYNIETTTHTYIANNMMVHNCTYCLAGDTPILMEDLSYKNIEDIKVGDKVIGCNEFSSVDNKNKFFPSRVTKLFHHKEKVYEIVFNKFVDAPDSVLRITGNHPIMLSDGSYKCVKDIDDCNDIIQMAIRFKFGDELSNWDYSSMVIPVKLLPRDYNIYYDNIDTIDVYNIETECHTYIANNVVVHNCYQFNKSPMRMEFDTAKKFIDHLLNDDYGYINRYNSPAIIIEFIGGEPLLEIKLTRQIYEYFLDRCYELDHPWFTMHRLSICSNGLQYFDEDVQDFFKDYASNISFNISIDGNKELHDSCRIQPNGEGSYDIAMLALNHFNTHYTSERNSKMTLAPSNIKYLFESVKDFIDNGMTCINLNCVFEEGWTTDTARIEYYQLKQLADYIIDNNLENIYIALFNERQEDMQDKSYDGTSCGGQGSMTAIRPNGQIYPCIRYMPTSVGDDVADMCMGSVDDGWNERSNGSEVIKILDSITRRSSSNDICYECPISNNCPGCIALCHAVYGTPNKRTTFHCIQHIAEALANVYYWNKLLLKHPDLNLNYRRNVVPDSWSLLIIDDNELSMLKELESLAKQKIKR